MPDNIQLEIKIPGLRELVYFPDHFPGFPILPGVIQLAWVAHFGAILFELHDPEWAFSHLEIVKFIKIIQPGEKLTLTLKWKAGTGYFDFSFASRTAVHSSGRMVYHHFLQPVTA